MASSRVWKWRNAIMNTDLASSYKLVLIAVSFHMNSDGKNAWPAVETICRRTSLSRPTVIRYLKQGQADGWIKRSPRGKHMSFGYIATFPQGQLLEAPSKSELALEVKPVDPNSPTNSPLPLSLAKASENGVRRSEAVFGRLERLWPDATEAEKRQAREIWFGCVLPAEWEALLHDAVNRVDAGTGSAEKAARSPATFIFEWLQNKTGFSASA